MTQRIASKCFVVGSIALLISAFLNIVHLVNNYDSYVDNNSSHVISAFDG